MQADPTIRTKTRYRGVSYRERADGARSYAVFFKGKYIAQDAAGNRLTSEGAALERQAELRGAKRRGEKPIVATKTTFGELAEQWLEGKSRNLRERTTAYYRDALDRVLLPRFGGRRVASISADDIATLIRDLESEGLHAIDPSRKERALGRSSIENYLKPMQGTMALAVRRRLITSNPFDQLTSDDRPKREAKREAHHWSDDELAALLEGARTVAAKQESRYDYTPLLKLTSELGLRCGEVLGLRWEDFDEKDGYLHVRRQWLRSGEYGDTKTRAGVRSIPLSADQVEALKELRKASTHAFPLSPIFASRAGTPLGHRNVTRRGFEAARDEANLDKELTFHDLRHAAASRMIDSGLDPVTVAGVLGHENANITLGIYAARFNRQSKDEAVRAALGGKS